MIRIASAAAVAVLAAGISIVGIVPANAAVARPETAVCKWIVTATGLWIQAAPNDTSKRVGETFKGYSVAAPLPLTEKNNYVLATSNGVHGYMDVAYLKSEGCN